MHTYLAFLRGINVGGKSLIKMQDLVVALEESGLQNVKTYIQSGNIIFESEISNVSFLSDHLSDVIHASFGLTVATAIFTDTQWRSIIENAPNWWGVDKDWKHNLLILTHQTTTSKAIEAIRTLKPAIELLEPGNGVIYQSMSLKHFGRTTTGKLASNPIYQTMTVRNYNTATKILSLLV